MPSKSPAQAKLMRAVAHGWKPSRIEGPSRAVAQEFVDADRKYSGGFAENRYYTGGLAAMNMQEGGDVWTPYGPAQDYGEMSDDEREFLSWDVSGGGIYKGMFREAQAKLRAKYGLSDPAADGTVTGPPGGDGPPGGGYSGWPGYGGFYPGGGGGWSPPPGWVPPGELPPGEGPPLTGGPPGPGAGPPTNIPPSVVPPPIDRRAGRDTPMSEALRTHRQRVASSLSVPEGGYAEGGHVNYYQEGGAARPGHAERANPYPENSARYKLWEHKHHVDPAPPPVAQAPEPEDISWLQRILGVETERKGRTERELEEMGEAYGGYIDAPGYQFGGLASANFRGPPGGGVPPRVGMMNPRGGIPRFQPGGPGGAPPWKGRGPPRMVPPSPPGGFPGRGGRGFPGRGFPGRGRGRPVPGGEMGIPAGEEPGGFLRPGGPGRPYMPGRGFPGGPPLQRPGGPNPYMPGGPGGAADVGGGMMSAVRNAAQQRAGAGGVPGGPSVPPNMRGYLQRQRMMNRPPANVGGGVNRVGQQDQQGGLARALQRGTGRRPMSRRGGFPGRNIR